MLMIPATRTTPGSSAGLKLQAAAWSVPADDHATNEDHFLVDMQRHLFMVADGIGGARAGSFASQLAVELLASQLPGPGMAEACNPAIIDAIRTAFLQANQAILARANASSELFGMGSTATTALLFGRRLFLAACGDSRAYLLRDGHVWQYTVDHTMAQALVSSGVISRAAARHHRWRNTLWKYLGSPDLADGPDISVVRLEPGDRFLLVTDGVTDVLDRHSLGDIAMRSATPADAAWQLVRAALQAGSRDDATCLAIFADGPAETARPAAERPHAPLLPESPRQLPDR